MNAVVCCRTFTPESGQSAIGPASGITTVYKRSADHVKNRAHAQQHDPALIPDGGGQEITPLGLDLIRIYRIDNSCLQNVLYYWLSSMLVF